MSTELKNKVNFQLIRYSNCWEDAEILVRALQPLGTGKKFLSIASAGDNSLMLLTLDPTQVVAVDLNPMQLYLVELKIAAIRCLTREQVLQFLGFLPCKNRVDLFGRISTALSTEAFDYWTEHATQIEKGIIHEGKFEKYFQFFSRKVLPLIHTKKRVNQLLEIKTDSVQKAFYEKKWNNRRWRFFFKIFFSKYIMGKYGRDPEFLKQVNIPVSRYIYQKAAAHLSDVAAQNNFMLHYQLKGNFGECLPPYLQAENYELIKNRLDRILLFKGDTNEATAKYGKFDGMNLSNIFEYMDHSSFEEIGKNLAQALHPGGILCYWNLMVPRRISEKFPEQLQYLEKSSQEKTDMDKGFFYSRFVIEQSYQR